MMDGRHISQEDLTLHAMQALSPEESAEIHLHLAECASCRTELSSLSGDLALIALSVDQHPLPSGARQRFIDKIASSTAVAEPATQGAVTQIHRRPASRAAVWVPWLAVAALLILAVSLGLNVQRLNERLNQESDLTARLTETNAHAQEVLDVLTAPSAQRVLLTAAKSPAVPTGRAIYLASRGGLIFQANNLARLAEDKTYELWVIPADGSAPLPAGLFQPDASGNASVVLPSIPKGVPAKAFGVTVEKASGSATPTAPIILSGAAPATGD
jgi:hypothetical protein